MTEISRLTGSGHIKITPGHLRLMACVYVRQSSLKQVLHNRESQFNQYQLVQQAEGLGWKKERIWVIDADLGLSGQESQNRTGFKDMVAEVSLGHIGIIFGYEVSRLARNNSDWYHLLDLAAMFGTLIADNDGIYDPRLYNDRLLLGLKGTMSEAELHLIRQRLEAGRLNQVRRGEYRQRLPTGLVRLTNGTVVKEPDEQVVHTLELVLTKFVELGSCRKVTRYCRGNDILLPRGQTSGQILWKAATCGTVRAIILNPAYAGAFAYGQLQNNSALDIDNPSANWYHLQQNVYPAYISWEQYLANQKQLHQNDTHHFQQKSAGSGTPGRGTALLQGLVRCGQCGHRMYVDYKTPPGYNCDYLFRQAVGPKCTTINAAYVDQVVVQAFFEAIQPAQLDVLSAMVSQQQAERAVLEQHWQERLKRARYDVALAQRQYDAIDPDNRLVAAELERRWEEKLVGLQSTQEDYTHFQQEETITHGLTPQLQAQFQHLSEHLPQLWQQGVLSNEQKKDLLRCLISQVILKRQKADTVSIKIVWVSGHYSVAEANLPIERTSDLENYQAMLTQIEQLWQQGLTDEQIATHMTTAGFRSARSLQLLPSTVQLLRLHNGWYHPLHLVRGSTEFEGRLTSRGLAELLGVSQDWVRRHIRRGQIPPQYVTYHPHTQMYLIDQNPALLADLRQQAAQSHQLQSDSGSV